MKLAIIGLFLALSSFCSGDPRIQDLGEILKKIEGHRLPLSLTQKISDLETRNFALSTRPSFCPLNNTQALSALNDDLNSIEQILREDCSASVSAPVGQIISGGQNLQGQISQLSTGNGGVLDASQMSSVVNGLNQLINSPACGDDKAWGLAV